MSAPDRAPAQYCPYCGETNLWPHETGHGSWECRDCARVFTVKYLGLSSARMTTGRGPGASAATSEDAEGPSIRSERSERGAQDREVEPVTARSSEESSSVHGVAGGTPELPTPGGGA